MDCRIGRMSGPSRRRESNCAQSPTRSPVPQTRDYRYAVAKDRVLLVGTSRIVVGSLLFLRVRIDRYLACICD
jgi:hypothetical protein